MLHVPFLFSCLPFNLPTFFSDVNCSGVPLIRVWSNKVNPTTMKLLAPGLRNDFTGMFLSTRLYEHFPTRKYIHALV